MGWGEAQEPVNPLGKLFGGATPKPEVEPDPCSASNDDAKTVVHGGAITCDQDDGKWYLYQEQHTYELVKINKTACGCDQVFGFKHIKAECVPFYPIPQTFKAAQEGVDPAVLPSFDKYIEVMVEGSDEPVRLHGSEEIPSNMIGVILCINGEFCYIGDKPVKEQIACGGTAEDAFAAGAKIWLDGTTLKGFNDQGQPVQLN